MGTEELVKIHMEQKGIVCVCIYIIIFLSFTDITSWHVSPHVTQAAAFAWGGAGNTKNRNVPLENKLKCV